MLLSDKSSKKTSKSFQHIFVLPGHTKTKISRSRHQALIFRIGACSTYLEDREKMETLMEVKKNVR